MNASTRPAVADGRIRLTWWRVFRSEWPKLWSLPTAPVVYGVAVVVMVGGAVVFACYVVAALGAAYASLRLRDTR